MMVVMLLFFLLHHGRRFSVSRPSKPYMFFCPAFWNFGILAFLPFFFFSLEIHISQELIWIPVSFTKVK